MNNSEIGINLNDMLNQAMSKPLEAVSPSFKQSAISETQIGQIIKVIMTKYPTLDEAAVLTSIILVMLKGAASNNTPDTLGVEVNGITVTKRDIKMGLQNICNNQYLRRLAESLAVPIGKYAERNQLDGELAGRLSKLVSEDNMLNGTSNPPLDTNERAWASSFSQTIKNLGDFTTARVVNLLALDYGQRFGKPNQSKKTTK